MVMNFVSQWMTMFVNLLLVLQRCCYANDCVFQYTQQPPSFLTCNPYSNATSTSQLQVTFVCGAQRNHNKKDVIEWTFDLKWFSNNSFTSLHHEIDVRTPSFTNATLLVISPGQYWCQVLHYTNGGDGHLLGRTNVVEVLSWNQYTNFSMCIGYQSVVESKCADLSPTSSATPATGIHTILMTEILPNTITESSSTSCCPQSQSASDEHTLSQASALLTLISPRSNSHASAVILDHTAHFTHNISATIMSGASSSDAINLILIVVMVPLLILLLLLMAWIAAIVFFFRQKALFRSKSEPTAGPVQEEETNRCPQNIYVERQNEFSPQLHVHEYELSNSLGFCVHASENSCEPLSSQIIDKKVYVNTEEHQKNTEEQQQPAPPNSEYAVINKSKLSCKGNETSAHEIIETQYSFVKKNPKKDDRKGMEKDSQDVQLNVLPTLPPRMYLCEEGLLPKQDQP